MTDPTASAADASVNAATVAPGWYLDDAGQHRWWDGRGWTAYTAPQPGTASDPSARPALPAGTRVDTAWVWIVSTLTVLSCIPMFFFPMDAYMATVLDPDAAAAMSSSMLVFIVLTYGMGFIVWAGTVAAAFADYRHLVRAGVVRPFHWAFAFIPYPIVYLIGRFVVLRKVTPNAGWPLWTHIFVNVVTIVVSSIYTFGMVGSMWTTLSELGYR